MIWPIDIASDEAKFNEIKRVVLEKIEKLSHENEEDVKLLEEIFKIVK